MVIKAFKQLQEYIENENYKGWDLFDGLKSSIFFKSPFYKHRFLRLAWIQFFKRSPLNLRKLAKIPQDFNVKGLALFVSGYINSNDLATAETLIEHILKKRIASTRYHCWGYNFDWESRAFFAPEGLPNIVTTVFVAQALMNFYDATHEKKYLQYVRESCRFILEELILHEDHDSLCFGYIPGKSARVHNANMLGASLFGRMYAATGEDIFLKKSKKAMNYAMKSIKEDFSWAYGERSHHQWIDNFHTGFNLVALNDWMQYTHDYTWSYELEKAYEYFLDNFWLPDGCPKYYNTSLYPIDIHCSAQGIITCIKLKNIKPEEVFFAEQIAQWAITNMQDPSGYFYYQKTKFYTNKIPYIRWSQAWMFYALSFLTKSKN